MIELTRNSSNSVLKEYRETIADRHDLLLYFTARQPDDTTQPMAVTERYQVDGQHLLFKTQDGVFVHQDYFSDLSTCNALAMTNKTIIGKVKQTIPIEILVPFLIQADILLTYAHIKSQMTISFVSKKQALVTGVHIYYTHTEALEKFQFIVVIEDGSICVEQTTGHTLAAQI